MQASWRPEQTRGKDQETHGKLAGRQLGHSGITGILVGQLLVLVENALVAKEKPPADAERGLGLALS
ncbi:hypothetical protein HYQ46_000314 [Verticillium longisporum]|nr:hypothetical protein HYQ46_000314 [Verticillium longisporum]